MSGFKFVVCIPARYASSRLPGKPLLMLKGKPLIIWALEAAHKLSAQQVVVATDDERIFALVEAHGYTAVMTRKDHPSGTDRIAECAEIMGWDAATWVLNYQGDEPNVPAANVQQVIDVVEQNTAASIGTLCQPIESMQDLFNPNVVKLVTDDKNRALYFSRAPIPWSQKQFNHPVDLAVPLPEGEVFKHHIGLYMYKVEFLKRFTATEPSQLEQLESLEQLRALSQGDTIVVATAVAPMPHGIDTPEDVVRFEQNHS